MDSLVSTCPLFFINSSNNLYSGPVIFLTANDTEKDMIEGFQAGCDDYIAKPFSVERIPLPFQKHFYSTADNNIIFYNKQSLHINPLKRMLTYEGGYYAAVTIGLILTLGNVIIYTTFIPPQIIISSSTISSLCISIPHAAHFLSLPLP